MSVIPELDLKDIPEDLQARLRAEALRRRIPLKDLLREIVIETAEKIKPAA